MNKRKAFEALLFENALSKGSQRVMNNAKMIPDLADAIRDDVRSNPSVFPAGSKQKFQKASDEELANWFLENLDKIERAGYEGTVYSRDGVNNEWIARRYIAGSHNWEDLIGVMNMNLRDWYLLKNRNMLDAAHQDLFKFNGVRDVGRYLSTHYHDKLKQVRDAAAQAAVKKIAKTAKIVDNDDYTIYTVFNWAGARAVGMGTQWCTANSEQDTNYKNYASKAMLFQMFPKDAEETNIHKGGKVITGPEKYQFDAGSHSFMDISDTPVKASAIREKFPYLYYDLVRSLSDNKSKLQTAIDDMVNDPAMGSPPAKVMPYKIDDEIRKLKYFIEAGFFTDKKRPPKEELPGDVTQSLPSPVQQPPEGNQQMENVDKDVAAMLESLKKYDKKLMESVAPVLEKKSKPDFLDVDKDGDKDEPMKKANSEKADKESEISESTEVDQEVLAWMKRFNKLGKMG